MTSNLTRREFIAVVGAAGGGLVLAMRVPLGDLADAEPLDAFTPNIWLRIDPLGDVTITVARSELGQGARTGMAMIVADELEADWAKVRIEPAVADAKYGSMTTGGSSSVRGSWVRLRQAGAAAREMLVTAAAATWAVDRTTCRAESGAVVHTPTGRKLDYGALVEAASRVPVPENAPLKDPKDFRYIGKSLPRLDIPDKVTGRARFGIDTRRPGALVAVLARSDVFGGKARSFDATRALAVPGVRRVLEIPAGIAVLADTTWAALRGREALQVDWDPGPNAALTSESIRGDFEALSRGKADVARREGDPESALASAARRIDAVYELPFLAHAALEPMNCLAEVRDGEAEIWAPTQSPQWARGAVAGALDIPEDRVTVHTTLVGGAFGRRLMVDYAVEAARLSKLAGVPVQVVWTREEDIHHDYYRPASLHRLSAGLDAGGRLVAWTHRIVAPSIGRQNFPDEPRDGEPDVVDGAKQLAYTVPNLLVDCVVPDTPVPIGWWRSVYNTQNGFVNESFMDEVAAAAGVDPYEFRRRLLPEDSRLRRALDRAAREAGWGRAAERGRARGLACHPSFGSFVAEVVDISVDDSGRVRVHDVVCAVDAGPIVHPDAIAAQVEGCVALALSALLGGEITLDGGRVVQSNFDDYPILEMAAMPRVATHIVPSTDAQGGVGEPPLPPVAPAVCNAIYAATGKRIRRLPLRPADLRGS